MLSLRAKNRVQFFVLSYSRSLFLFCGSKLIRPSLYILTRYVQSFGVLALPDVVVNLALHYRIVKISGRVVDDHFRGVVADHLLLINEPPKERGKEKKKKTIEPSMSVQLQHNLHSCCAKIAVESDRYPKEKNLTVIAHFCPSLQIPQILLRSPLFLSISRISFLISL